MARLPRPLGLSGRPRVRSVGRLLEERVRDPDDVATVRQLETPKPREIGPKRSAVGRKTGCCREVIATEAVRTSGHERLEHAPATATAQPVEPIAHQLDAHRKRFVFPKGLQPCIRREKPMVPTFEKSLSAQLGKIRPEGSALG